MRINQRPDVQLDLKDPRYTLCLRAGNQCENAFHCMMTKLMAALRLAFSGAFEMPVSRYEIVMAPPSPRADPDRHRLAIGARAVP